MLVRSEFRQIAAHLAAHYSDEALTPREIEVLWQIAGGNRNRDIAEKLFITAQTLNVHMKHIIKLRFQRSFETGKKDCKPRLSFGSKIGAYRSHAGPSDSTTRKSALRATLIEKGVESVPFPTRWRAAADEPSSAAAR